MTVIDFLKRLYDLPKDVKIVFNSGGYLEIEIKLFLVHNAPTVEKVFKTCLDNMDLLSSGLNSSISIDGYIVKDIVFHNDHYKCNRFYEITIEQDENRRTKN